MRDVQHERIQRELFLAAFGANVGTTESWVTDRLSSLLEEQPSRAGDTLFRAGDPPEFYYFLRQGQVQLVRDGSAPWTYEGRSVFGMSDALLERPRVRTALALTNIEAMKVQSEAWIELLEDSFSLARAAVLGSVRTVAELEQRLWAARRFSPRSTPLPLPSGAQFDVIERLAVLTEAPLLRGAGVQTLSDLAAASDVAAFEPGETLIARGTAGGRVLLLLEGEVEAAREAPDVALGRRPGRYRVRDGRVRRSRLRLGSPCADTRAGTDVSRRRLAGPDGGTLRHGSRDPRSSVFGPRGPARATAVSRKDCVDPQESPSPT